MKYKTCFSRKFISNQIKKSDILEIKTIGEASDVANMLAVFFEVQEAESRELDEFCLVL